MVNSTTIAVERRIRTHWSGVLRKIFTCCLTGLLVKWGIQTLEMFSTYEATKTGLIFFLFAMVFSGLFNTVLLFSEESSWIMERLRKDLPISSYLASIMVLELMICLMEAAIMLAIFRDGCPYPKLGIVTSNATIDYYITFFLILFSNDALGLALGICFQKTAFVIPIVLIMQLLMSGCLIPLEGGVKVLSKGMSAYYGFTALGSIADLNASSLPNEISRLYPMVQKITNDTFRADAWHILYCWEALLVLIIVAIALAYKSLQQKICHKTGCGKIALRIRNTLKKRLENKQDGFRNADGDASLSRNRKKSPSKVLNQ